MDTQVWEQRRERGVSWRVDWSDNTRHPVALCGVAVLSGSLWIERETLTDIGPRGEWLGARVLSEVRMASLVLDAAVDPMAPPLDGPIDLTIPGCAVARQMLLARVSPDGRRLDFVAEAFDPHEQP